MAARQERVSPKKLVVTASSQASGEDSIRSSRGTKHRSVGDQQIQPTAPPLQLSNGSTGALRVKGAAHLKKQIMACATFGCHATQLLELV